MAIIIYIFKLNVVDFELFDRRCLILWNSSRPIVLKMQHGPVDIRYDAEGHDADGHKDKGTDEANSDTVLPFLGGVIRLSQRDFQPRIVFN